MKVAVVGVTGLVGTRMVEVLEERNFPVSEFIPVASERSKGKEVVFKGQKYKVITADEALRLKPDLAIFSAGASASRELAPRFAEIGCRVVDNSSCWRMDNSKKLVIPEINADVLTKDDYIIANPNCSTIQMLIALAPIHRKYGIKRVVVSTYQSVTGSGNKAVAQMEAERKGLSSDEYSSYYPHPIDMNIIPHIDVFLEDGYTKEERKMIDETHKILGDNSIGVCPTAARVPVLGGHSESINLELKSDFTLDDIYKLWSNTEGLTVIDKPSENQYPMPLYSLGKDDVFVGRLRKDPSVKNGLAFWCVSDNIRKGAATNAVQIAEVLLEKGYLRGNSK